MELLLRRSRGESVITQQLSSALQEMAQAMERSNDRFLETTATVDEMAGSVRQVASEAEQIARAVEVRAHALGGIDESMARIRAEAQKGANAAQSLRVDAEEGLIVVDAAISEMERIEHEGEKTRLAMQRLAVQAAATTVAIVEVTEEQQKRTRTLIAGTAQGTSSVRAIARAIHEQQIAIERIQHGVIDMKGASDLMARGLEEQIAAKQAFDGGLVERGEQFKAINDAVRYQLQISEKVMVHFASSEERLKGNAERTAIIDREILALEEIGQSLQQLADRYGAMRRR